MSKMRLIPFDADHLLGLRLQAAQSSTRDLICDSSYAKLLRAPGLSWTGIADGVILGCAGLLPQWRGRSIAWAILSEDLNQYNFLQAHRAVSFMLDAHEREQNCHRIEATVHQDFEAGHRWMGLLNFTVDGIMEKYSPDGATHVLYSRVS